MKIRENCGNKVVLSNARNKSFRGILDTLLFTNLIFGQPRK